MDPQPKIAILLPTFNGENFLPEQLDSLFNQTYKNFVIVTRDDVSTDSTTAVVQSYRGQHPEQVQIIDSQDENLGASGNFGFLMQYALDHKEQLGLDEAYMMFCDQDDIWDKDKIAIQISIMLERESTDPGPMLVHSDLRVVSGTGQLLSESFMVFQGLRVKCNHFRNLLVSNLVTGCTVALNEKLARLLLPIPRQAIMHDWWAALVCSAFGKIIFLNQPLVDYRQHEGNTLGAKKYHKPDYSSQVLASKIVNLKPDSLLEDCAIQARTFSSCYGDRLKIGQRLVIFIASVLSIRVSLLQRLVYRLLRSL